MKIVKYGDGNSARPHTSYVIANSAKIFIGGAVKLSSGKLEAALSTDPIYGICVGFIGADGNTPYDKLNSDQKSGSDTYVHGVSLTVHSNNQTVAKTRAKVVPVMPNDVIRIEGNISTASTASSTIGNYVAVPTGGALTADARKFEVGTVATAFVNATGCQFMIDAIPNAMGNFIDAKLVKGQIYGRYAT